MEKIFALVTLTECDTTLDFFKTRQEAIQHVMQHSLDKRKEKLRKENREPSAEEINILLNMIMLNFKKLNVWWDDDALSNGVSIKYEIYEKELPLTYETTPALPTKRYVVKGMLSGVLGKKIFDTEKEAVEYAVRAVENEYKRRNTPIDVDALRLHLTTAKWIGKEDLYYGVYEYKPETDDALLELPDLEMLERMPEYN